MRLLTFRRRAETRLGVYTAEDRVVDLAAAAAQRGQPTAGLSEMRSLLEAGPEAVAAARALADNPPPQAVYPAGDIRVLPPLDNPGKILCVGRNYAEHAREGGNPPPEYPVLFAKFPSSIIGPGEAITWPQGSSELVDYEAELAVVIGRQARGISAADALAYVAGYTLLNDITARDWQRRDGQWVRAKSFDTFCPLGPHIVTPDEVGDPQTLRVQCRLNGETMQDGSTADMIFSVAFLIEYISRTITLYPGDIIATGTPDGVGAYRTPPVRLKPGDTVEVEVDRVGVLSNPVV